MRIDLRIKYQCGCTENVRTDINFPADLANAPRTPENDLRIMEYIRKNYRVENWCCEKNHRSYTMRGFDRILEILN